MKYSKISTLSFLSFLLFFVSCSSDDSFETRITEGDYDEICVLGSEICQISEPSSFDIVNQDYFVIADEKYVSLYSTKGKQLRLIGNAGNARYEYNRPTLVRSCGDSVYVWSSMSLKFISYSLDGVPGAEYPYNSAVRDFDVSQDKIWIYTAGSRQDNLIDILYKSDNSLTTINHPTSGEHKQLLRSYASAALKIKDGKLLCASKDTASVHLYDAEDLSYLGKRSIPSKTFRVRALKDSGIGSNSDRQSFAEYLRENSMTLMIIPNKTAYKLLTLEGVAAYDNQIIDNRPRFFGLYDLNARGFKSVRYINYDTFGQRYNFSDYNGELYYIFHEIIEDQDVYKIRMLKI